MFKKDFKIKNKHLMSQKDKKKLIKTLEKRHPKESITYLAKAQLSVAKVDRIKMTVYLNDQNPLWLDLNSKGDVVPTLYTLFEHKDILKNYIRINFGVERYLKKGADLMWPGVINFPELGDFSVGELAGVVDTFGVLVALGKFESSKAEFVKGGVFQGVALKILFTRWDSLFQFGALEGGEKFLDPIVRKIVQVEEKNNIEEVEDEGNDKRDDHKNEEENDEESETNEAKLEENLAEELNKIEENDEQPIETNEVLPKNMDDLIKEAFFNAVKLSLTKNDVPIEVSLFWNNHVLRCKTGEINIKKSSFKKIGKFLSHMDEQKIIKYAPASKKNPVPQIIKVNKAHPDIKSWTCSIEAPRELMTSINALQPKIKPLSSIEKVYFPHKNLQKYMKTKKTWYLYSEIFDDIKEYLKSSDLMKRNQVFINSQLSTDLKAKESTSEAEDFPSLGEAIESAPSEVTYSNLMPRKEFWKKIESRISEGYKLTNLISGEELIKRKPFEGIRVVGEKFRNKFITKVSRLEPFVKNFNELVSVWQNEFATSGTVKEVIVGKKSLKEVVLQGTFVDHVQDFLKKQMGIHACFIKLVYKVDQKRKKKTQMKKKVGGCVGNGKKGKQNKCL